ncbi:virulence factor BrkB family protein [Pseudidiomarina mangrovi]|uniref:virulence factor BrkB family protein n=1 Tax=Pseudidiomarina mangrovi TaxID=2487133 RepID=UPI001F0C6F19|nr:virulence factor BrkB family protein [Pseudidiomarina mangrovi]
MAEQPPWLMSAKDKLVSAGRFLRYFGQRCLEDRITIIAGHLTFVSMLALVPMLVVVFSIFSAFPMFTDLRLQLETFLFANLMPTSGEVLSEYLNTFIGNVSKMTGVGVVFVIVVAVNLISTIDATMNRIWRNKQRRRLSVALAVYWMILTLGPLLMGSGMAVTSYVISLTAFADDYVSGFRTMLLSVVPVLTSLIAFVILYVMMPNRVVKVRHAIWGALVAAILFELAKRGFAAYITAFPSYEAIYGALAAIPIMLLWIFVSWNIVLVGAELTASIEEFLEHDSAAAESD